MPAFATVQVDAVICRKELDGLEREIPTVLVDPLPPDLEQLTKVGVSRTA